MEIIKFGIDNYFIGNVNHQHIFWCSEYFVEQIINPIEPSALSLDLKPTPGRAFTKYLVNDAWMTK